MAERWWQNSIVYQIYPQSFNDSNNDGVGDIRGIIQKLDYLYTLGITVIWICPIFQSPMVDNGYDISDYYAIQEQYGSLDDLVHLIEEARKRGIKILLDLVINHCSDQHAWFKEALNDPEGEYGQYFIFRKGVDGREPNNWRSIFGGSVWQKLPGKDLYYYHTFTKHQPDLNWENERLRHSMYEMIRYWLALGIAGFRIDAATFIKKDLSFRSLPPDRPDGLVALRSAGINYPGIEVFLHEMKRQTFDRYNAFCVAEMSSVQVSRIGSYIGHKGFFSSIFDFSCMNLDLENGSLWYRHKPFDAQSVKNALFPSQEAAQEQEAYLSIVLENHDQPRALNKWFRDEDISFTSAALLAVLNLTLRGIPFIYQGQEIGTTNRHWSGIDEIHDVKSLYQYESAIQEGVPSEDAFKAVAYRSRDNARSPIRWNDCSDTGKKRILPGRPSLPDIATLPGVDSQLHDAGSLLHFYRRLIALRKNSEYSEILTRGDIQPLTGDYHGVIAYARTYAGRCLHVVLNYQGVETSLDYASPVLAYIIGNYGGYRLESSVLALRPFEALVLEVSEENESMTSSGITAWKGRLG